MTNLKERLTRPIVIELKAWEFWLFIGSEIAFVLWAIGFILGYIL